MNDTRYDFDAAEFDNLGEAVRHAQMLWGHLARAERSTHDVYVLESSNPDEEADDHFDGDEVYNAEWTLTYGEDVAVKIGRETAYVALTQQPFAANRMCKAVYQANGIRKDTGDLVTVYWEIRDKDAENEEAACDWYHADDWEYRL